MQHKYRKIEPIKAEQFDGSKEMMNRYPISVGNDQLGTWYKILTLEGLHLLSKGDWIVSLDGDYLVIEESLFRRTYERCD